MANLLSTNMKLKRRPSWAWGRGVGETLQYHGQLQTSLAQELRLSSVCGKRSPCNSSSWFGIEIKTKVWGLRQLQGFFCCFVLFCSDCLLPIKFCAWLSWHKALKPLPEQYCDSKLLLHLLCAVTPLLTNFFFFVCFLFFHSYMPSLLLSHLNCHSDSFGPLHSDRAADTWCSAAFDSTDLYRTRSVVASN